MKKVAMYICLILISISVFLLGFNYKNSEEPNVFYQVYLDENIIGVIKSKAALEKYINQRGEAIKNKYNIKDVYSPNGLEIKKVVTYQTHFDDVNKIYSEIEKQRPFTIMGYQFTIKGTKDSKKIFVTEKEVFHNAVIQTTKTFVGTNQYLAYETKTQSEITTIGRVIENIDTEEEFTIKQTKISVTETIYSDSNELAKFLLFGTTNQQKTYTVQMGETIEQVSLNNKISVEEFLISNPNFTSATNLLFPGQQVVIGVTDPQIKIVEKEYVVKDIVSNYKTDYVIDSTLYAGDQKVVRNGENGLIRVKQKETSVNGMITIVSDPESREELQAPINKIINIGSKQQTVYIGDLGSWGWPTNPGWTITSAYGYRINPINGTRELHDALDIAGTGEGSNIYAVNNGIIVTAAYTSVNGNYIIINHGNGYYSLYAHLKKLNISAGNVVERGQVIGYMGHTGWATGTHLHFAIYNTVPLRGTKSINTWLFYR